MNSLLRSQWDEACALVRHKEDPFFHDPWLDRVAFVRTDDATIVLATPNRLYVEFIQENLESLLVKYLEEVTASSWQVSYTLDSSLGPLSASQRVPDIEQTLDDGSFAEESVPQSPAQFRLNPSQSFTSFIVGNGNQFASAARQIR